MVGHCTVFPFIGFIYLTEFILFRNLLSCDVKMNLFLYLKLLLYLIVTLGMFHVPTVEVCGVECFMMIDCFLWLVFVIVMSTFLYVNMR